MFKRFSTTYMVFLFIMDLILTAVALRVAGVLRFHLPYGTAVPLEMTRVPPPVYGLTSLIWTTVFMLLSVYDSEKVFRAVDEFQTIFLAVFVAAFALAGMLYLTYRDIPRFLFLYFAVLDVLLLIGYRGLLRLYFRIRRSHEQGMTPVLIIGAGRLGREVARTLEGYRYMGLAVIGFLSTGDETDKVGRKGPPLSCWQGEEFPEEIPFLGTLDQACHVIEKHGVKEVIVAMEDRRQPHLANLVAELQTYPVRIKVIPSFFDLAFPQARVGVFAGIPMVGLREPAIDGIQRFIKRLFDLIVSTLALLLLWPLMLIIAALIKLDSPGPAIFRQQRVGENGELFCMYKFRSMVINAEQMRDQVIEETENGQIIHKKRDDPRITRMGRWLRRTSLDELPQLLNVLKGEMSLVGPRPEMPWLVDLYEPWQRKRFAAPPGITGWWQVNGRSNEPMHLHTEDDLYYIQNYSLLLDLQIIWRTIATVVKGEGAF
jgi:exopolysaccharide biosynthesis polyprenyl glycosylphosphotransferase